jgi:hypothetical protein
MRSLILRAATVALAILALPSAADAGWMTEFTGNTQTGLPGAQGDGVINFAVFDNTGTTAASKFSGQSFYTTGFATALGQSLISGSGNIGSLADLNNSSYIYVYQMVNTNPRGAESDLEGLFLKGSGYLTGDGSMDDPYAPNLNPGWLTAAGWANGYIFHDGTAKVGPNTPTNNQRLGGNDGQTGSGSFDTAVDGKPSEKASDPGSTIDVNALTIVSDDGGITVSSVSVDFFPEDDSTEIALQYHVAGMPTNTYSYLMIIASNHAPIYQRGTTSDGQHADGDIPVPSPEPGTLALIGLGLPLLGWGYVRRLRANKAVAAAVTQ